MDEPIVLTAQDLDNLRIIAEMAELRTIIGASDREQRAIDWLLDLLEDDHG